MPCAILSNVSDMSFVLHGEERTRYAMGSTYAQSDRTCFPYGLVDRLQGSNTSHARQLEPLVRLDMLDVVLVAKFPR
jgi:hypothetical protein